LSSFFALILSLSSIFAGAIGSVHLLPVYRSSGDGGFAPICYTEVDPDLGTWDDVKEVADRYDLCVEFMVNHISPQSDQFQDFLAKGDDSEFAEMFIDWDKFWPEGRYCAVCWGSFLLLAYEALWRCSAWSQDFKRTSKRDQEYVTGQSVLTS
jgi:glycosidase